MRLIDANKLEKWMNERMRSLRAAYGYHDAYTDGFEECMEAVENAETIVPDILRPTGHWNIHCYSTYDSWTQETDEDFYLECSECKREVWNIDQSAAMGGEYRKLVEQYPYCHCGCKMEG